MGLAVKGLEGVGVRVREQGTNKAAAAWNPKI